MEILTVRRPVHVQGAGKEKTSPPRGIDFAWYAFVKRTRDSQKISKTSGNRAGINSKLDPRNQAGKTCCWPRKKDPVAMKNPKDMRQRWRTMRLAPKAPPRTSMRMSPAAASSITEPRKKCIPVGTPSFDRV